MVGTSITVVAEGSAPVVVLPEAVAGNVSDLWDARLVVGKIDGPAVVAAVLADGDGGRNSPDRFPKCAWSRPRR